jgi:hypothetical protein
MQTRATAVGSTSKSRLLRSGSAGARLPAVPCDDKGKGAGVKASIKLLQYVFALVISGAGFATMIVILHHALR